MKRTIPCLVVAILMPVAVLAQTLPTASQVAAQMTVGWNVGNSLEVPGGETGWGNPVVNQQLITAVKNAGFNSIRIPCAWDSHADQSTMTIDPTWLARVKQVVDYAINSGMYVVLNEHWDGGWLEEHPLYSYQTSVNAKQKSYWTQIANYFKSYNEHLLFAGTNEVHADYNTPTTENITVQQSFNQTFVDAVRATGGNNASRTLVVQTYNTNIQHGLNYFTPPTDSASSRLMVEVHYYDPYDYTLNSSGSCLYWGAPYPTQSACTWAYESYVDSTFAQVKSKWVSAGYPVIIGEYGVAARSGLDAGSRAYYLKYINQSAKTNGIKTFYWDNGVSGNNGFALFDRNSGAVVDQTALTGVLQGAGVTPGSNYTLTVSKSGTGTCTVASTPAGISCGSTCSATFPSGTNVNLIVTPGSGSIVASCNGSSGSSCTASMTANKSVAVVCNASTGNTLTVTNSGTGSGTVTSSPAGINCGSTCSASYASGTGVTLTATAASGSTFTGWSGACSGTGTCTVTMSAAQNVTATFALPVTGAININSGGAATGIFQADAYYSGGSTYSTTNTIDTSQITGTVPPQAVFQSERYGEFTYTVPVPNPGGQYTVTLFFQESYWSAAGQRKFNVALNGTTVLTQFDIFATAGARNRAIAQSFSTTASNSGQVVIQLSKSGGPDNPKICGINIAQGSVVPTPYTLTVSKNGTGSGTVTGTVQGGTINCGSTCSATVDNGTSVVLTATAASGSTFAGWSGCNSSSGSTCTVTVTANQTVTATFNGPQTNYTLSVNQAGSGSGSVTLSPAGGAYAPGTVVTLSATPASGSTFGGWSGGCTGTSATCTVTMNGNLTVTATWTGSNPGNCKAVSGGQSGNFNTTGAACFTVTGTINGWGCSNADGRTVTVNNTATTCGKMPLPGSSPYTFSFTAGTYAWASFYWW